MSKSLYSRALLSQGLKFIPTPVTTETNIRRELLKDFALFARRMRLHYIYLYNKKESHIFFGCF